MQKQLSLFALCAIVFAAVAITAIAQKGKEDKGNKKEQQQGRGQDKADKGNKGNQDNDKGNSGKADKNDRGNNGKDNGKGNDQDKGNGNENGNDNNDKGNGKNNKDLNDFRWDDNNFADRKNIRNSVGKVTLCHKPNRNGEPGVTLSVASPAVNAHLNHGDQMGDCPDVTGNWSDDYLRRRTDYYNVLQNSQEQVIYSRSILDYALQRLTGARTQLVSLQRTLPPAEYENRRLMVVDLENNVSLLQQVLGVTATLVANKLMD